MGKGGVGGWKRVERSEDRPQRGYVVGVLVGGDNTSTRSFGKKCHLFTAVLPYHAHS